MGENLPIAGSETDEDLDLEPEFTFDEYLDEIVNAYRGEMMREGDITVSQFARHYNMSTTPAKVMMERICKEHPELYEMRQVYHRKPGVWVLRKKI